MVFCGKILHKYVDPVKLNNDISNAINISITIFSGYHYENNDNNTNNSSMLHERDNIICFSEIMSCWK